MRRAHRLRRRHDDFLPPPVSLSDEEPIATGGRQVNRTQSNAAENENKMNLPPSAVRSDEEPNVAGGW